MVNVRAQRAAKPSDGANGYGSFVPPTSQNLVIPRVRHAARSLMREAMAYTFGKRKIRPLAAWTKLNAHRESDSVSVCGNFVGQLTRRWRLFRSVCLIKPPASE